MIHISGLQYSEEFWLICGASAVWFVYNVPNGFTYFALASLLNWRLLSEPTL